mgnify:FL=1
MIQSLKTCWYWFINLLAKDKLKKPDKNTSINNTTNNLEENEIKIVSVRVRYVKEKEN